MADATSQRWDRMRAEAGHHGGRAKASAEDMRRRLHEGTESMSEAARKRVVEAREAAYRAQRQVERAAGYGSKEVVDFYNEQPLVAGALALALGATIGAALPRTHAEDDAVGESSDRLFEEAERVFREESEKAQEALKSASSSTEARTGTEKRSASGAKRDSTAAASAQAGGPQAPR